MKIVLKKMMRRVKNNKNLAVQKVTMTMKKIKKKKVLKTALASQNPRAERASRISIQISTVRRVKKTMMKMGRRRALGLLVLVGQELEAKVARNMNSMINSLYYLANLSYQSKHLMIYSQT